MPHEPKKRHSRQRQGTRRAAIKLIATQTIVCKNCGSRQFPHIVCPNCGYYKGRLVKAKKEKIKPSA
jgi:large subunit ribosomal protein L32